jgi:3-deoxy-manno-octulosonate cytidylyltransferase (CMP-KDO synthetase)
MARLVPLHPEAWITGGCPLRPEERDRPSAVKVVVDEAGRALDFCRLCPPETKNRILHHKGIYGSSAELLHLFTKTPQTVAERRLSLEQMRIFPETPFHVIEVADWSPAVDLPEDLDAVRALWLARERGE